jgi:peptidoglycan pentaglycine glycine transferase (the first glycine)
MIMEISATEWNAILTKHPEAHLLQSSEWGELKSHFGWIVKRISAGNTSAQVLFRRLPLGFSFGYIAKGPLGKLDESFLHELRALGEDQRAIFIKIEPDSFSDGNEQILPETKSLAHSQPIQPAQTIILDLEGEESDILGRMKQKTRYNINLAIKKGIQITQSNDIRAFYKMMTVTGSRDGFGIHSLDYYQQAYDLFSANEQCVLLTAKYEDMDLASVLLFRSGEGCWYFYGASTDIERNRMPVYLLQWEAIRWAKAKGCKIYDLWGIPDGSEAELEEQFTNRSDGLWGVYRFKRGFGGYIRHTAQTYDLVINPLLYKIMSIWLKWRRGGRDIA